MKTPIRHDYRPGLDNLPYRVGAYDDFRQSMLSRLSDRQPPYNVLNGLRTRSPDDPTIALIDAFAVVCDVLTFYQERLANEGFLRTAKEPRSLEDLARLTGYRLRPGVASSVYLAFTLDPNSAATLPAGSRAQSVPGPGQTPQTFETSADLAASGVWNAMRPRQTQPTVVPPGDAATAAAELPAVMVDGAATGLKPNDPLLVVVDGKPRLRRIKSLSPDFDRKRTRIDLQLPEPPDTSPEGLVAGSTAGASNTPSPPELSPPAQFLRKVSDFAKASRTAAAAPPLNAQSLPQTPDQIFAPGGQTSLLLSAGLTSPQQAGVFRALSLTPVASKTRLEVHAFRASTAPFGNRAPPQLTVDGDGRVLPPQEWLLSSPSFGPPVLFSVVFPADLHRSVLREFVAGVIVTITLGVESVRLAPLTTAGSSATHAIGTGGQVTATLTRLDDTSLEIAFAFSEPLLSFSLSVEGTNPPITRIVRQQPGAPITVEAGWDLTGQEHLIRILGSVAPLTGSEPTETPDMLYLDGAFETITPGSWVAFDAPAQPGFAPPPEPMKAKSVNTVTRVAYGQTARSTRLKLSANWLSPSPSFGRDIRQTMVYADSAPLNLLDEDIDAAVAIGPDEPPVLELDRLVTGLDVGRLLIVEGERTDLKGVTASEVAMVAAVAHGVDADAGPDDEPRTTLTLVNPLAFSYVRATVRIYGNVAAATQGESCDEILGGGDGSSANQSFTLKKQPVTQLPAATPSGAASTLRIFVNGIEWREVDSLATEAPDARVFVTSTADNGGVAVSFGDGVHGARLPSGAENVRARYRAGLGPSGNLDAGVITNLLSRPLGVTGVTNPVPASGGASADDVEAARRNIPTGLVSLARLVSVADYRDFALAFAGIGKADARLFPGPDGPLLHLTVAGAQGEALDAAGALWNALAGALLQFGDAGLEVEIASRVARLAVVMADIAVEADRLFVDIEPQARAALYEKFGFAQRDIGQSLYASEVVATLQTVPGVLYVNLRLLVGAPQPTDIAALKALVDAGGVEDLVANVARVDPGGGPPRTLLPGELVYLSDTLPQLLMLNEVQP